MPSLRRKATPNQRDTREHILGVARDLFALHGYAGVGMRVVAERTGLSKSALFHHFPTKLSRYGAVLCRILEKLEERSRVDLEDDPMAQLKAWAGGVIDMLAEDRQSAPLLLRALFEEEALEPADERYGNELMATCIGRAHELLRRGMDAGRFHRVPPAQTIQSAIGMIVFHFASGDFGNGMMGESIFAPEQVDRRKEHVLLVLEQLLRVDG